MSALVFSSCGRTQHTNFTASTPASALVRNFLGISLTDSIDFIRWTISINGDNYSLNCNYGIGKPNTNGFYDGGKKVRLQGPLKKEQNIFELHNNQRILKLAALNSNLLHILNEDNTLMIGNAGWSYAINSLTPSHSDQLMLAPTTTKISDSMAFQGRTPCGVPGASTGQQCYKLKWYVVFYGNAGKNEPVSYRISGTGFRLEGGKTGKWKINTQKDGRSVYELFDETGKPFLHLLKLDDGVLIFTDDKGNLLVGDHDFSYTLNRKF